MKTVENVETHVADTLAKIINRTKAMEKNVVTVTKDRKEENAKEMKLIKVTMTLGGK